MFLNIEDFFRIFKESAWSKDIASMQSLYHESVVIFDMWDKACQSGISYWNHSIEKWLAGLGEERVKVDFHQIDINQSADIGFATALINFQAISPEHKVLRGMTNRITIGCIRENEVWKVVHQHTSAPISSHDLSAILTNGA